MDDLKFVRMPRDSVEVWQFIARPQGQVTHWPGLLESGRHDERPWQQFAVSGMKAEEVAVLSGLAWSLGTEGRRCFAIPTYWRDEAAKELGTECELVDWEFAVEADVEDPAARAVGFVPARTPLPSYGASDWQVSHEHNAGLFALADIADLVALLRGMIFQDAAIEVNLFFVRDEPRRRAELAAGLRGGDPPTLSALLRPGELFVDLSLGIDLGYVDGLFVASHDDLDDVLTVQSAAYRNALSNYERSLDRINDGHAFLAALHELRGDRS